MKRPWMPLYIADYLKKTTHLGALESGAYLHLIMDYWQNDGLPDEDRQLARIAKMTDREWKRARPVLQAFFYDGWKHKRIDEEIKHAAEVSEVRSKATAKREEIRRQREIDEEINRRSSVPSNDDTLHTTQRKEDTADAASSKVYAFESGVIRLNQPDFDRWKASFSHLDLAAELVAITPWANEQGPRWFFAVANALAKRNREVKANKDRAAEGPEFKWNGMEGVI